MDRWKRRKMVYRGKMLFYRKHYGVLQEWALRLMLFGLSFAKLASWCCGFLLPGRADQAKKELRSNLEVMALCLNLK
jgi:hypothetical protein